MQEQVHYVTNMTLQFSATYICGNKAVIYPLNKHVSNPVLQTASYSIASGKQKLTPGNQKLEDPKMQLVTFMSLCAL